MLENAQEIILDARNNKYAGPEKQFTIVIDKFNGKEVEAWHIETAEGKTQNLAERAKGEHIDVVVSESCRSTAHFFSRVYKDLYREQGIKLFMMSKN